MKIVFNMAIFICLVVNKDMTLPRLLSQAGLFLTSPGGWTLIKLANDNNKWALTYKVQDIQQTLTGADDRNFSTFPDCAAVETLAGYSNFF